MESKIEKILKKILKVKVLKNINSSNFKYWDSIAQMEIVMEIEENFNIQLSEKEILKMTSPEKIKEIIKKKI